MTQSVQVMFYDGQRAKPYLAELTEWDRDSVRIRYKCDDVDQYRRYAYQEMALLGAVGRDHPVIDLKDDARIEFSSQLPDWFQIKQKKLLHSVWKIERTPSLIVLCIALSILIAFSTVRYAVPYAAYQVAQQLPENTMKKLGDEAEAQVTKMTATSKLPQAKQTAIRQQYEKYIADGTAVKIVFRSGKSIGANALAIPNNTIVLTDELVELAANDQEILGVLAHEQGHLKEKHSLQQALTGIGLSIIWIAITGDGGDFFTSVPVLLVSADYSRKFELSADRYALQTLSKQDIPTIHFANFLTRLEAENGGEEKKGLAKLLAMLSSHPSTAERVQAVKDFKP